MDPLAVLFRRYLLVGAGFATVALSYAAASQALEALDLPADPGPPDYITAVFRCLVVGIVMAYLATVWHRRAISAYRDSALDRWLAMATVSLVLLGQILGAASVAVAWLLLGSWAILQVYRVVALHDAGMAYAGRIANAAGVPVPRGLAPYREGDRKVKRPPQPSPCSFCGSREVQALVIMPDGAICGACAWSDWKQNVLATHCALCATPLARDAANRLLRYSNAPGISGPNRVACARCTEVVRYHFAQLPPLDDDVIATLHDPEPPYNPATGR